jgi:hypothetical protein
MYCMGVKSNYCPVRNTVGEDDKGIIASLLLGKKAAEYVLELNLLVQVVLGVFVLDAFLAMRAVEVVTGPALAPMVLLLMGVALLKLNAGGREKKKCLYMK